MALPFCSALPGRICRKDRKYNLRSQCRQSLFSPCARVCFYLCVCVCLFRTLCLNDVCAYMCVYICVCQSLRCSNQTNPLCDLRTSFPPINYASETLDLYTKAVHTCAPIVCSAERMAVRFWPFRVCSAGLLFQHYV